MVKIKVLEDIRAYMVRIGLHSYNLTEPKNEFFRSFVAYYILLTSIFLLSVSSIVYMYNNFSSFDIISEPFMVILAGILVFSMFLSVGLNMKSIKTLQIELEAIVEGGKFLSIQIQNSYSILIYIQRKILITR